MGELGAESLAAVISKFTNLENLELNLGDKINFGEKGGIAISKAINGLK